MLTLSATYASCHTMIILVHEAISDVGGKISLVEC